MTLWKSRPILILAIAVLCVLPGGCATAAVQKAYFEKDRSVDLYVYGGTWIDICMPIMALKADNEGTIGILLIFDLPFSLVADTIVLPLAIYEQIDRASWPEEPEGSTDETDTERDAEAASTAAPEDPVRSE